MLLKNWEDVLHEAMEKEEANDKKEADFEITNRSENKVIIEEFSNNFDKSFESISSNSSSNFFTHL